ncbi:hypothetical protein RPB_2920 [Rhodopseudomonas palustris HaA2]|uniref:Uncharacterized protein n=2 Tax=Rhodopseudomonas palustris TaxID=1076 RepID=Q2IVY8_RHOP2|nr:hypothetical protein RPB_2920 [Rhodopseudomonas palustris HaA2]
MRWVGQVSAVIADTKNLLLQAEISIAIDGLQHPGRADSFQKIMITLYKALGEAELIAPADAKGSFVPVGNTFDAFSAVSKILGSARHDVLLVDPYLDDSVLVDFGGCAPEGVPVRLLTDEATVKPSLAPAVARWKVQYPSRPVEVRLSPARTLHDRAIFIDNAIAWTVTQSLKDLAKRSPAELVRVDDTASLKISAYDALWHAAQLCP